MKAVCPLSIFAHSSVARAPYTVATVGSMRITFGPCALRNDWAPFWEGHRHWQTMRGLQRFGSSAPIEREVIHARIHTILADLLTRLAEMQPMQVSPRGPLLYYRDHFPIAEPSAELTPTARATRAFLSGWSKYMRSTSDLFRFSNRNEAREQLPSAVEAFVVLIDAWRRDVQRRLHTPPTAVQNLYFHICWLVAGKAWSSIDFQGEWEQGQVPFLSTDDAKQPFVRESIYLREFFTVLASTCAFQGPAKIRQLLSYLHGNDFIMDRPFSVVQQDLLRRLALAR